MDLISCHFRKWGGLATSPIHGERITRFGAVMIVRQEDVGSVMQLGDECGHSVPPLEADVRKWLMTIVWEEESHTLSPCFLALW
jgi:hypothetical protein